MDKKGDQTLNNILNLLVTGTPLKITITDNNRFHINNYITNHVHDMNLKHFLSNVYEINIEGDMNEYQYKVIQNKINKKISKNQKLKELSMQKKLWINFLIYR